MFAFMIRWAPDWAYDLYRWHSNTHMAKERFPRYRDFRRHSKIIRKAMWGR